MNILLLTDPEECNLEGPYECPCCSGHMVLDVEFLNQVQPFVVCPYCQVDVSIPSIEKDGDYEAIGTIPDGTGAYDFVGMVELPVSRPYDKDILEYPKGVEVTVFKLSADPTLVGEFTIPGQQHKTQLTIDRFNGIWKKKIKEKSTEASSSQYGA